MITWRVLLLLGPAAATDNVPFSAIDKVRARSRAIGNCAAADSEENVLSATAPLDGIQARIARSGPKTRLDFSNTLTGGLDVFETVAQLLPNTPITKPINNNLIGNFIARPLGAISRLEDRVAEKFCQSQRQQRVNSQWLSPSTAFIASLSPGILPAVRGQHSLSQAKRNGGESVRARASHQAVAVFRPRVAPQVPAARRVCWRESVACRSSSCVP